MSLPRIVHNEHIFYLIHRYSVAEFAMIPTRMLDKGELLLRLNHIHDGHFMIRTVEAGDS